MLRTQGDMDASEALILKAMRMHPASALPVHALGDFRHEQDENEEAIKLFSEVNVCNRQHLYWFMAY
jgi:hypothetical protein